MAANILDTVAPLPAVTMIIVAVIVTFDGSNQETVVATANRVTEITRGERGCISYEFLADINRTGRMLLFEEWESEATLDTHLASPHLAEFRSALAAAGVRGIRTSAPVSDLHELHPAKPSPASQSEKSTTAMPS